MASPPHEQPRPLVESVNDLSRQLVGVRATLTLTNNVQQGRLAVLRRLALVATGSAALATAGAVAALVLLLGAIGDLRDQQDVLDAKTTADCAFHREVAALPDLVRSVPRSPGSMPPTVGPVTSALGRESANAYRLAGCPEVFGALPTHASSRPSGSPRG
ncbi:hypothetical protein ACG83_10825 [Frankia sp. R43]|uniref:hypothetical protein n=1 Tax=Frankia sp. R43 TaxID=269536 RepID=UPI0006CA00AB|nr:hypothetical protein [Frankia sp. R43]KPM55760.1 hypothetical protein ACG83_10825 [Frankia sp. R43]